MAEWFHPTRVVAMLIAAVCLLLMGYYVSWIFIVLPSIFVAWKFHGLLRQPFHDPMPGPPPRFFFGNMFDMDRTNPVAQYAEWAKLYGPIYRLYVLWFRLVVVSDPEAAKYIVATKNFPKHSAAYEGLRMFMGEGLVTTLPANDHWKFQREIAEPGFHKKYLDTFAADFGSSTQKLIKTWIEPAVREKKPVDMDAALRRLSLDLLSRAAFKTDYDFISRKNPEMFDALVTATHFAHELNEVPLWRLVHPVRHAKLVRAVAFLRSHAAALAERDKQDDNGDSLLKLLLVGESQSGKKLSTELVLDNIMTFFFAGSETTAGTMLTVLAYLALHPECQDRLQHELDAVLGDRLSPVPEDFAQLRYLDACIKETLRLAPPAAAAARNPPAGEEYAGQHFKHGDLVIVNYYALGRLPQYFADPDRFDPDRWLDGSQSRHPFSYIPFAAGPRSCVGKNFANQEMRIVIGTILKQFSVKLAPGSRLELEYIITVRPKPGMLLQFERR